jgi:tungstate transport system substrate-binding protein
MRPNKVHVVIPVVAAVLAALPLPTAADTGCGGTERDARVVRVVVIGGMTREVDLWPAVAQKFEEKTGYRVELVETGTVDVIAGTFAAGEADLLTMHSNDTTTNLVADGYGTNMRPWTHNELVIMGPKSDPAGIQGMTDGVEALKRIAAAGELGLARFVDLWGTGKREVAQDLWTKTGIYPVNKAWFLKDLSDSENRQLVYTASLGNAYCLFGRVPVIGKKVNTGGLQIMVEGDVAMQRPYIVMEANPKRFPCANDVGARKLSSFLLSGEIQDFLPQYRVDEFLGLPPFYPLRNTAFDSEAEP